MSAEGPATLGALLAETRRLLDVPHVEDPALEARMIVEHFSGTRRADAIADPGRPVPASVREAVADAVARRLAHEPVHRIFGFREFYGLKLALSPDTLEPRPDTEALVEAVLPFVRDTAQRLGVCRILDLGTGTGAIALALLSQEERAVAVGVDISDGALATAVENAAGNGLAGRFRALSSDWFSQVGGRYHAIVSNPPYISAREMGALDPEVANFDPHRALHGGADGLDAYRVIAAGAGARLEPGGRIGVEIGYARQAEVTALFTRAGFRLFDAREDLAGTVRALVFEMK